MGWLVSLFLKISTIVVFISLNAFAGGLEVSRQNNMLLFENDRAINFSTRTTTFTVTDNVYTASDNQSAVKKLSISSAAFKSSYCENISYVFEM